MTKFIYFSNLFTSKVKLLFKNFVLAYSWHHGICDFNTNHWHSHMPSSFFTNSRVHVSYYPSNLSRPVAIILKIIYGEFICNMLINNLKKKKQDENNA